MVIPYWTIPELWPGSTVFILGGGPSLQNQDLTLIHNHRVIGVNHSYRFGPWVDICWYGDVEWYKRNREDLKDYAGLIVTCAVEPNVDKRSLRVRYVRRAQHQYGLEASERDRVCWNSNSGTSAVNLAYWLGAKRIVLLGFDMKIGEKGDRHWHDFYKPRNPKDRVNHDPYPRFMKGWPRIKEIAQEIGLEIINATPDSTLTLFGFTPLEEVCQAISAPQFGLTRM